MQKRTRRSPGPKGPKRTAVRKRAEEALKKLNETLERRVSERTAALSMVSADLKRAQTVAHIGNWRLDVQNDVLKWSDENHRIFGVSKGTAMTYESFLALVYPDDRDYVDQKWKAALAGEPYSIEHRIVVGDQVRWVREKAELEFDRKGRLKGGFGTTQDITELKLAEQERERLMEELRYAARRLNLALTAGRGGAWDWDFLRGKLWWSPEMYSLTGIEQGTKMDAEKLMSLIDPRDRKRVRGLIDDAMANRTGLHYEFRILHPDLGERWIGANAQIIYDGSGRPVRLLGITMDITRQKKAEEVLERDKVELEKIVAEKTRELLETQREMEKAGRLSDIGTLAATVAHELRNPLAAIAMASYNIKRKRKNPALDKHLKNIDSKVQDSDQIINNLLFYSRLRMPNFCDVDIHGILEEAAGHARVIMRNIKVDRKYGALKRATVKADPLQIKELFNNIMTNACDAVVEIKKPRIEISAGVSRSSNSVGIKIRDNGPGIDKNNMDRLFEPFFSTKSKGTGLGLTVCYQIVRLHGGRIAIRNGRGGGTSVTVELPMATPGGPPGREGK